MPLQVARLMNKIDLATDDELATSEEAGRLGRPSMSPTLTVMEIT